MELDLNGIGEVIDHETGKSGGRYLDEVILKLRYDYGSKEPVDLETMIMLGAMYVAEPQSDMWKDYEDSKEELAEAVEFLLYETTAFPYKAVMPDTLDLPLTPATILTPSEGSEVYAIRRFMSDSPCVMQVEIADTYVRVMVVGDEGYRTIEHPLMPKLQKLDKMMLALFGTGFRNLASFPSGIKLNGEKVTHETQLPVAEGVELITLDTYYNLAAQGFITEPKKKVEI